MKRKSRRSSIEALRGQLQLAADPANRPQRIPLYGRQESRLREQALLRDPYGIGSDGSDICIDVVWR